MWKLEPGICYSEWGFTWKLESQYAIQSEDWCGSLSPIQYMPFRMRIHVEAWAPVYAIQNEDSCGSLSPGIYAIQSEDWCGSFILSPVYAIQNEDSCGSLSPGIYAIQNEDWCGSLSPGICYCSVYVNHAVYPYHTLNKFYTVHAHNNHAFTFCQSACLSEINVCIHFQN